MKPGRDNLIMGKDRKTGVGAGPNMARVWPLIFLLLIGVSCRQDMQDQPRSKPYRASDFFRDGMSSRSLVEGTVPRGYLREDVEFFTGKKRRTAPGAPPAQAPIPTVTTAASAFPDDVEVFPLVITEDLVRRGKERFEIFCSVCHGLTGYGDGMVVRRGFRQAANFHDERLREAPVGHFFDVVTNGWGAMPSYATQIPPQDRWAIIAYVRALQLAHQSQDQPAQSQPAPPANQGEEQR